MSHELKPAEGHQRPRRPQRIAAWLRETIVRDLIVALVVGVATGTISGFIVANRQEAIDDARTQRELTAAKELADLAIRVENLRFVRSQPDEPGPARRLSGLDLSGMNLANQFLTWDDFSDSNFANGNLNESNAFKAVMRRANLTGTRAEKTNFKDADFRQATLSSGSFRGATFAGADLQGIDARGADFSGAHFELAKLAHADLRGAILADATLNSSEWAGTCHDATTVWPAGFSPGKSEPLATCGPDHWSPSEAERVWWED